METNNDLSKLQLMGSLGLKRNIDDESSKLIKDLKESQNNKYKPTEYVDLLTEEKPTRDILSWIKSWDELVFGKKFQPKTYLNVDKNTNQFQSGNNINNFKKEIEFSMNKYKIILIAGSPGMGKTTLARVLANHCKYQPIVINASDERTSEKLLLRIYDTTQLEKLKFKSNKGNPTCLILDEIDGAMDGPEGKNAIKSIISFIKNGKINQTVINKAKKSILSQNNFQTDSNNAFNNKTTLKENTGNDSSEDEKEKLFSKKTASPSNDEDESKSSTKNVVKRPIICICNDLYSKVLTLLRKEALVINIKADPIKLERRLKDICVKEKLNIDFSTIKNLCKQTNYDIRACINSLQFISYNQNNSQLIKTLSQEKLFMIGCKDITAGLFDIWNKIFSYKPAESNFNQIWSIYNSHGEYEKINEGIFVNYISNPINNNDELVNRVKLLEYLSYDDILTKKINTTHSYELSKFHVLPGAFVKNKYSTEKNKNLKFPLLLIDLKKNKKDNSRILSSLKENFNDESCFAKLSKKSLVSDVLPYIYQLIQPEIREINPELMNKPEIRKLHTAVNLMLQFGIKFIPDELKNEEEDLKFYEPDIKNLLNFNVKYENDLVYSSNNHNNNSNFYKKNHNSYRNANNHNNNQETILIDIKNTRITRKQIFIIRNEFEKIKNIKENLKDSKEITNNTTDEIKEKINKINLFEPMTNKQNSTSLVDNNIKNTNMTFGIKRNYNQFSNPEVKFVYKFNEGVTNTVRRNLNINYFLNN